MVEVASPAVQIVSGVDHELHVIQAHSSLVKDVKPSTNSTDKAEFQIDSAVADDYLQCPIRAGVAAQLLGVKQFLVPGCATARVGHGEDDDEPARQRWWHAN